MNNHIYSYVNQSFRRNKNLSSNSIDIAKIVTIFDYRSDTSFSVNALKILFSLFLIGTCAYSLWLAGQDIVPIKHFLVIFVISVVFISVMARILPNEILADFVKEIINKIRMLK
jgi:hypothetical protein